MLATGPACFWARHLGSPTAETPPRGSIFLLVSPPPWITPLDPVGYHASRSMRPRSYPSRRCTKAQWQERRVRWVAALPSLIHGSVPRWLYKRTTARFSPGGGGDDEAHRGVPE